MSKLYEIANEYAQLMNEDLEPEMIADTIEGMEGEFTDKLEQMLALIKNEQSLAEALKEESKSLAKRAKAIENKILNITQYMIASMETMDKKSLTAGVHKLTIRKGVQSVDIEDLEKLPVDYVDYQTVIKADKNLIKEKLKLGESIEGATLVTGKPSLIIK